MGGCGIGARSREWRAADPPVVERHADVPLHCRCRLRHRLQAKTTKKIVLRLACTVCKAQHMHAIKVRAGGTSGSGECRGMGSSRYSSSSSGGSSGRSWSSRSRSSGSRSHSLELAVAGACHSCGVAQQWQALCGPGSSMAALALVAARWIAASSQGPVHGGSISVLNTTEEAEEQPQPQECGDSHVAEPWLRGACLAHALTPAAASLPLPPTPAALQAL